MIEKHPWIQLMNDEATSTNLMMTKVFISSSKFLEVFVIVDAFFG